MEAFAYANPTTIQEAVGLLGPGWADAAVLAGGTDLISLMKDMVYTPKRVVNIKNIKELGGIRKAGGGLRIGATVTMDELLDSADVRSQYPALADAARGLLSPQLRNMRTVGGDLCQRPRCWYYRSGNGLLAMKNGKSLVVEGENRYHAIFGNGPAYFVSASSFGPALIAYGAKATVASAKGNRDIPLEQFFVSPQSDDAREIALQPGEIVTEIVIPAGAGAKSATYEVREREAIDWPLATASVSLTTGRIVLGHVAPTPYVATKAAAMLKGRKIDEASAEEIGRAAVADAKPLSQNAYKVQLAKVAVKRALLKAAGVSV